MEKLELYRGYDKNNNLNTIKTVNNIDEFIDVISVFKGAPYYEILSKNDCEKEFEQYNQNGLALGFYINNEIAGVNCLVYESDPKHSIYFSPKDQIAYYSGFAVKPNYRKLGIGKLLIRETDKYLESLKLYDYSYARILLHGSMSEGIFRKYGFEDAYVGGELIIDDVEYERNNQNVSNSDKRKYMVKTFNDKGNGIFRK